MKNILQLSNTGEPINKVFLEKICRKSAFVSFYIFDNTEKSFYNPKAAELKLLQDLQPYIVRDYEDICYLESEFGESYRIIQFRMHDLFEKFMLENYGQILTNPEFLLQDISFYDENRKCIFHTITHEGIYWTYDKGKGPELDSKEIVGMRKAEIAKNHEEQDKQRNDVLNSLAPLMIEAGFAQKNSLFYKILNREVLLFISIESEEDLELYYDALPLCIPYDEDLNLLSGFSLSEYFGFEEVSMEKMTLIFRQKILPEIMSVRSVADAYQFRKTQIYECCDEEDLSWYTEIEIIYAALKAEYYEEALRYMDLLIAETEDNADLPKDLCKDMRIMRKHLISGQVDEIMKTMKKMKN